MSYKKNYLILRGLKMVNIEGHALINKIHTFGASNWAVLFMDILANIQCICCNCQYLLLII